MSMSASEMIAVIQAHAEGKTIQCKVNGEIVWCNLAEPIFNFGDYQYRVKQDEPKTVIYKCYSDGYELRWWLHDKTVGSNWIRVPSEDKVITL